MIRPIKKNIELELMKKQKKEINKEIKQIEKEANIIIEQSEKTTGRINQLL